MNIFTKTSLNAKSYFKGIAIGCLAMAALFSALSVKAQTTVTYTTQTGNFYSTYTTGTAGAFNSGAYQVGMYANGGGTKQVVMWRKFRTDASGAATSDRAMQIGDEFVVTLSATQAYGRIGFALLASPSATNTYAGRESNYALSVNLDGPSYAGSFSNWYIKYNGGSTSSASFGGGGTSYKNFTFTMRLTAANRMNVTMTDGTNTSSFYDVQLNSSNPITDYSIFLEDDWNGSANSNAYWGLGALNTQHKLTNTGDLRIGESNSSFTIASPITNGFDANNTTGTANNNQVTKYGTGTITLAGVNTYKGGTIVEAGELRLNPTVNTTSTSPFLLDGGSLSTTGIASGVTISNYTFKVGGSASLNLGSNPHTLQFANSSGIIWTGTDLTINGWTGTPGASGTGGKIFFGTDATGLAPAQLAKVTFTGYTGATLLSTGELVPQGTSSATNISSFSASPNDGTTTSGYVGSTITLTGAGFIGVTSIKYGGSTGTAVSSFNVVNDNTITFAAPAGMTGTIYISGSNGSSTSSASFTNLGYITNAAGDYMTAGTWLGGAVPPAGSTVTIAHNVTVSSAANSAGTLTINSGSTLNYTGGSQTVTSLFNDGTLSFSNSTGSLTASTITNNGTMSWSAGNTLNIAANGTLTNNGTFTRGTGTVNFVGVGTVNGSVDVTFNNVTINTGGLTLDAGTTIDGIFRINGGNISPGGSSPIYTANATLFYNTSYGRYLEWSANGAGTIGSTPGYPNNVTINTGSLDIANGSGARALAGNLTINTGASASISGMNAQFTVGGNLSTVGAGAFNMGATSGTAVVNGSITNAGTLALSTTAGGDLTVKGNFTNNGTFTNNARAINMNGTSAQTIGGSSVPNFHNLNINNAAGVTLLNPVTIANNIYLNNGILNTSSTATLTVNQTASFGISGGSSTSFINGPVSWKLPANLASGSTYVFPIGKGTGYYPFTLNNPTTGASAPTLTAESFDVASGGTADNATITGISNTEYWSLTATGNFTGSSVSIERPTAAAPYNLIGKSTTKTGIYASIGGGASANSIDNSNVTTGASQFFVMAVNNAAPAITSVVPTPAIGTQGNGTGYVGQTVTINGSSFQNGVTVKFGGVPAASVTYVSPTQLTAVLAANSVAGNVVVTNPNNITGSSAFTFLGYITTSAGDYSTAATWLGATLPRAGQSVTINNGVTVNGPVTNLVGKLTINSGSSLTFGASGALNIAGGVANAGTISMAAGGNLYFTGASNFNNTGTFTAGTGSVLFTGSGVSTVTGTVAFNKVALQKGVDFGSASTINGSLEIKAGGYIQNNAPVYATGSTLIYNLSGSYTRFTEWSATTGKGYPYNVLVQGGLNLDINGSTGVAPTTAGSLTIATGSQISMGSMSLPLTVNGNLTNSGTLTLSTNFGGDMNLYGNLATPGTLNTKNRAIFFKGANVQNISGTALSIPYLRINKTGGSVKLLSDLLNEGPSTGNAIELAGTASILDLNGHTLTIGKTGVVSTYNSGISPGGFIKGSGTSSVVVLGSGALGTITFDQTTDGVTNILKDFSYNRTSSGSLTLGNKLVITGTVTPVAGVLNTGGFLHLRSDINGTARVAPGPVSGNYVSGNVTVERYIPAYGHRAWRLLSIPTTGSQTINQAWQESQAAMANGRPGYGTLLTAPSGTAAGFDASTPGSSLLTFNPGNPGSWVTVSSTASPIATDKGYMVYIRGDRSATPYGGPSAQNATTLRTTGGLYQGNQNSFSVPSGNVNVVIGNVYASAIDFASLIAPGVSAFKVWDPKLAGSSGLGAYQTFSSSTNWDPVPGGGSYGSSPNTRIESGQAFIVSSNSGGSVTLTEASKVAGSKNNVFRSSVVRQLKAKLLTVSNSEGELADGASVVFGSSYAKEVDNDDAVKAMNIAENLGIKNDRVLLAVEARPNLTAADVIQLNLSNLKAHQYKFEIEPGNLSDVNLVGYLEDSYLHTTTAISLSEKTVVSFNVTNDARSSAADRFRIVFKNSPNIAMAEVVNPRYSVYPNPVQGKNLHVEIANANEGQYNVRLLTTAGQVVKAYTTRHNAGVDTRSLQLPASIKAGIYTLELIDPLGKRSTISVSIDQ